MLLWLIYIYIYIRAHTHTVDLCNHFNHVIKGSYFHQFLTKKKGFLKNIYLAKALRNSTANKFHSVPLMFPIFKKIYSNFMYSQLPFVYFEEKIFVGPLYVLCKSYFIYFFFLSFLKKKKLLKSVGRGREP